MHTGVIVADLHGRSVLGIVGGRLTRAHRCDCG